MDVTSLPRSTSGLSNLDDAVKAQGDKLAAESHADNSGPEPPPIHESPDNQVKPVSKTLGTVLNKLR